MSTAITTAVDEITVFLVDDHELARQGVRKILDADGSIRVIGESTRSLEAISSISQLQPDVVILDIRLEQGSGIDVSRALRDLVPDTKILVLTAYDDEVYVKALAKLGVMGYLLKDASALELRRAVHDVAEGRLVFSSTVATQVTRLLQQGTEEVL